MVLVIPEAMLTVMEAAAKIKQCDANPGNYAGVTWGIINEIPECKNM